MTTHGKDVDISLAPRVHCFEYNYTTASYQPLDRNGCSEASIDPETGVQTGGPAWKKKRSQGFAFYLPYELGFVKNFTVDAENHPRGCNIPEVYPQNKTEQRNIGKIPINCTRSTFTLEGENMTSADIVDQFADDHEVWAHAFIEGWQVVKAILFHGLTPHCRKFKTLHSFNWTQIRS